MIVAQQSRFDETRAPAGKHTLWAYAHVPNGSTVDMTERMEAQIERFAPGFRDLILARHAMSPAEVEARNPNYVGGDINGGVQDLRQLYTRPAVRLDPYSTAGRRPLPVLLGDAARRRRARHVRAERRPVGAPEPAVTPQRRTALVSVVAALVLIRLKLGAGLASGSLGLVSRRFTRGQISSQRC